MKIAIEDSSVIEAISKIAKTENRTPENMVETVLKDFIGDYNG